MCRKAYKMLQVASGTGTMYQGARTCFRLVNRGCTNRIFYHIVVAEKFREVKEQVIEQVGSYDPLRNERNEHLIALNFDRIQYWLGQGTVASEPVEKIFGLAGLFPIPPQLYMKAWRNRARRAEAQAKKAQKEAEAAKSETETK